MPDEPKAEIDQELLRPKPDYAWRWFALHTKQRVTRLAPGQASKSAYIRHEEEGALRRS